jgi:hypothetical protein
MRKSVTQKRRNQWAKMVVKAWPVRRDAHSQRRRREIKIDWDG